MKLTELYLRKVEERKQKQKQAVRAYIKNSKVKKIAEKLSPYADEIFNLIQNYGMEETRKVINTALNLKLREKTFKDAIEYLKTTRK